VHRSWAGRPGWACSTRTIASPHRWQRCPFFGVRWSWTVPIRRPWAPRPTQPTCAAASTPLVPICTTPHSLIQRMYVTPHCSCARDRAGGGNLRTGRVLVECQRLTVGTPLAPAEPLFCTLALYNVATKRKLSEDFCFHRNSSATLALLGRHRGGAGGPDAGVPIAEVTRATQALFKVRPQQPIPTAVAGRPHCAARRGGGGGGGGAGGPTSQCISGAACGQGARGRPQRGVRSVRRGCLQRMHGDGAAAVHARKGTRRLTATKPKDHGDHVSEYCSRLGAHVASTRSMHVIWPHGYRGPPR
jgi:hypothetical protein